MEEIKSRTAFWTVTLPDDDYLILKELGTWQTFQRRLIDRLVQYLKEHGDPGLVIGVVELGPKRSARTQTPMPHIHIVTTGWGRMLRNGTWLLNPGVVEWLIAMAAQDAGLPARERAAASNIQPVRASVRSYLSKYLSKAVHVEDVRTDDGWENLIPHQWWNRSQALKEYVDGCIFHLPPAFAAFVVQQRNRLESLGLGYGSVVEVGRRKTKTMDLPVEVFRFRWRDGEALLSGMEWFLCWCSSPSSFEREVDRCLDEADASRQASSVDSAGALVAR